MTGKTEKSAKGDLNFLEGTADYEGKDFTIENNPSLKNVRFEINYRNPLLGPDKEKYLMAHGGIFAHEHVFISNLIPMSMDGQYKIRYQNQSYMMSVFEETETKMPMANSPMKIVIKKLEEH